MPAQSDFATRTKARMIVWRNTFGTPFRVLGTDPVQTGKGVEDLMALTDFPLLRLEYEKLNAMELNPVVLDCIDPALGLGAGDFLTYPFTGSEGENENRMRVEGVQPVMLSGVEIRRFILIYNASPG